MAESLQDRVVLVTGAGKRIGRSIALALGAAGAKVAVHYRGSDSEAREVADRTGGEIFQADLADVGQIGTLFDQVVERFGRLDALVNNAAVFRKIPIREATEADWDWVHDANLKQVYFCCQAAARVFDPKRHSRIVNLSSLGGLVAWAGYGPYNASKAGVIHLTRSLAKELAPNVSVNSVAPGLILFGENPQEDQWMRRNLAATPLEIPGRGEDIAETVLFLLRGPRYITGQTIAVDGGLSLRGASDRMRRRALERSAAKRRQ